MNNDNGNITMTGNNWSDLDGRVPEKWKVFANFFRAARNLLDCTRNTYRERGSDVVRSIDYDGLAEVGQADVHREPIFYSMEVARDNSVPVTDELIAALRAESVRRGFHAITARCDEALSGDVAAIIDCGDAISQEGPLFASAIGPRGGGPA